MLGAGWLGWPLAQSWAEQGVTVTTVRRSAHEPVRGGRAVQFDLGQLRASAAGDDDKSADPSRPVPTEFRAADVIVAAVAPDRSRGDDYDSTYLVAARAAVRIAQASGARVLIWVSSTGVYGHTDGRETDETTERTGKDALCLAEDLILDAASETLRVSVLRVAGLYGPGRDPAPRFRDVDALTGRFGHWLNLAWRDDVIAAVQCVTDHALQYAGTSVVTPNVLNVADGTPLTLGEGARLVALADGRTVTIPSNEAHEAPPARSNQRIRVDALRAIGWTPQVPNLREGLVRLGYTRLSAAALPYGPQTAEIRAYLRDLAATTHAQRERVCKEWTAVRATPAFARADRALGEAIVRVHRESERDAAAAPLLQMMRQPGSEMRENTAMEPVAEPALAALMALVVRDALPDEVFQLLVEPVNSVLTGSARIVSGASQTAIPRA